MTKINPADMVRKTWVKADAPCPVMNHTHRFVGDVTVCDNTATFWELSVLGDLELTQFALQFKDGKISEWTHEDEARNWLRLNHEAAHPTDKARLIRRTVVERAATVVED